MILPAVLMVTRPAHASGNDTTGDVSEPEVKQAMQDAAERARQVANRLRAEKRLRGEDDGFGGADVDDAQISRAGGLGSMLSGRSGLFGTALMAAAFYFLFMRNRGGGRGGAGWGSYYLFWIVAPALLAAVSSHPSFLIVIVVGLVARRWLPDPILILKHRSRVRALQADIDANASNATARRDLAKIWLEKHRPRRALPLLEQALARDPDSVELRYLSGVSHLLAGEHERAIEALVTVTHREPSFQYGEAYLRAADALIALGRWDDAADALERYVKINSSNIEARWKRVRVCKARKDGTGRAWRKPTCATPGARCRASSGGSSSAGTCDRWSDRRSLLFFVRADEMRFADHVCAHRPFEIGFGGRLQIGEHRVQRVQLVEVTMPANRRARTVVAGAPPIVAAFERAGRQPRARPRPRAARSRSPAGCRAPSEPMSSSARADRARPDRRRSTRSSSCRRARRTTRARARDRRPDRCASAGSHPDARSSVNATKTPSTTS